MPSTEPSTRPEGAPAPPIEGRCLCGAVRFELQASRQYGPGRAMGVCHCSGCQRWTGGAGLPFVAVVPERFSVAQGQEMMAYYSSGDSTFRAFCRRCGSSLYQDIGTTYHVAAGLLTDLEMAPTFHLEVAQAPPWDTSVG